LIDICGIWSWRHWFVCLSVCSYFSRFVLLSKQLVLSRLIDVVRISVVDFVSSLTVSAADGTREACFKTAIIFDPQTGVNLFLAYACFKRGGLLARLFIWQDSEFEWVCLSGYSYFFHGFQCSPTLNRQPYKGRLPLTSWWRKSSDITVGQSGLIYLAHHCYDIQETLWLDMQPVDIKSRWRHNWKLARVVNSHFVSDPTIRQLGFDLPRQQWSLLNRFRTEQGHCGACRRKWWLTDTDLCPCGEIQTMSHVVESCPLTKLNGSLSWLHSADGDSVSWLTNYGSWHASEKKNWLQWYGLSLPSEILVVVFTQERNSSKIAQVF